MALGIVRGSAVRSVRAWSLQGARRHGSGGGAGAGAGVPTKPPLAWLGPAIEGSWLNRIKFQRPGSNPSGEDVVGLEGALGKYVAFMLGINFVQYLIPERKH